MGDNADMVGDIQSRSEKLSEWEVSFVDSIDQRLRKRGGLSKAQSDKLKEIWERVTEDG